MKKLISLLVLLIYIVFPIFIMIPSILLSTESFKLYGIITLMLCFHLASIIFYVNVKVLPFLEKIFHKNENSSDGIINDNIVKDRLYLLLLLAKSFKKSDRLLIEKKLPDSKNVILVFQMKNGNLKFSIPEVELAEVIKVQPINLNTSKINYNNNYRLIEELLYD